MKSAFATILLVGTLAFAQALPAVPGATSSAPIAVGAFQSYNALPPAGSKRSAGGVFLLYPAAMTTTGHPNYARFSIDVAPMAGCRGCLGTAFRFGDEQVLGTVGQFTTALGADLGVVVAGSSAPGTFSFNIREVYRFKDKSKIVNAFFVSAGGEQDGNTGVLSKFEVGLIKTFGSN